MVKKCLRCDKSKPLTEFNWKIKNIKLASYCKDCSRKYIRDHYTKNKKYYLSKARKRNLRLKEIAVKYIASYLKIHPCVDCDEKDILVLEFDHRDKRLKIGDINSIINNSGSIGKLIKEIEKCDVRCANCHRRKTALENSNWKIKYLAPVA